MTPAAPPVKEPVAAEPAPVVASDPNMLDPVPALSGADDMAVELFLSRRIGFLDIPTVIRDALKGHEPTMEPSIEDVTSAAAWARDRVLAVAER